MQRHAAAAGWMYGVVLAARDSASIGGTVATNAGGLHVIAHGLTRAQLVGIEAVMPDGSVVSHLAGLLKDNTGYDITALLCGAEGTLGIVHKLDVSVPLASLAQCTDELRSVVDEFSDVTVFVHLADGNIHIEIAGPDAGDTRVDHAILACVARYGGSISAEHGVGRAKAGELHLCRSAAEIAAMRAIKRALDPAGIMNTDVLFDP